MTIISFNLRHDITHHSASAYSPHLYDANAFRSTTLVLSDFVCLPWSRKLITFLALTAYQKAFEGEWYFCSI